MLNEKYEYYKGVDHINDDVTCVYNESIRNIMQHSDMNDKVLCFNTLGYLKNNINLHNLQSNQYINNETGHGLFVKNNITITDENFLYFLDKNVSHANIIMYGQFQHDQLFLEYKIDILQFIEQNKNSHYIKTDRQQKFLIKDIIDDIVLPPSKIYDIVIHIRLGDFNGRPDFIEYEYYEKLFETIDFLKRPVFTKSEGAGERLESVDDCRLSLYLLSLLRFLSFFCIDLFSTFILSLGLYLKNHSSNSGSSLFPFNSLCFSDFSARISSTVS